MHQVTIHEAKTNLSRLIQAALAGEEVVIAKGKQPLVKLVVVPELRQQRRIGGAEGIVLFVADDFDAPLEDFSEYMP
jgi:antitoxin (DNA-binding transcriptional repressor) of toxin-antitoxin stability system